ncbi:hypothetical protein, partial [uncultured Varibaculum sp.]|uniref:hypothetical protein n=1 Tax=uncultured Varibaculum sp. TaxID=413896 RepID=UPI002803EA95
SRAHEKRTFSAHIHKSGGRSCRRRVNSSGIKKKREQKRPPRTKAPSRAHEKRTFSAHIHKSGG